MSNHLYKTLLCAILSLSIANVSTAMASNQGMISTSDVVFELSHEQAQRKAQEFLNRSEVQNILIDKGVSPIEASERIAKLSEIELQQLAGQIEEARSGGILVTILLIILIIYFARRI